MPEKPMPLPPGRALAVFCAWLIITGLVAIGACNIGLLIGLEAKPSIGGAMLGWTIMALWGLLIYAAHVRDWTRMQEGGADGRAT